MNRSLVFDLATGAAFIARHEDALFLDSYWGPDENFVLVNGN
jgi:hypothetical protein